MTLPRHFPISLAGLAVLLIAVPGCWWIGEDWDQDGSPWGVDCDDDDPERFPEQREVPYDGVDNDCEDSTPDDDLDEDGFSIAEDCDDTDEAIGKPALWFPDSDHDGYGTTTGALEACTSLEDYSSEMGDCEDSDPDVNPDAVERCDGIDNDCDGTADVDAVDAATWFEDADGDRFGDGAATLLACEQPSGYAADGSDCDDDDSSVYPGAFDAMNGVDADCDGFDSQSLAYAEAKLTGANAQDYAGHSLAMVGDSDGDGEGDLLIGAYANDEGATDGGAAYLVRGPVSGDLGLAAADATLYGVTYRDLVGGSTGGPGDVNGDGFADLLVGSRRVDPGDSSRGSVYLFTGPISGLVASSSADAVLVGESAEDGAGWATTGAGDHEGDGFADMVVGADLESSTAARAGAVYVVDGPVTGSFDLGLARAKYAGEAADDRAGSAISPADDVDGDGVPDLLVGAYLEDTVDEDAGAAYLLLGPHAGTASLADADARLLGDTAGDEAGWAVAGVGDVTDDGYDDIVVSARNESSAAPGAGAVYFLNGRYYISTMSGALAASRWILAGEHEYQEAGYSVAPAGDFNGDGYSDLAIGSQAEDVEYQSTYLLLGPGGSGTESVTDAAHIAYTGESYDSMAGWKVAGGDDIDRDGFDDLLIGAQNESTAGDCAGAAYLVLGSGY